MPPRLTAGRQHVQDVDESAPLLAKPNDSPAGPDVISWGDEDPEHPYNWPRWQTLSNCSLVTAMTFLTALASSIIAPGVPQVMAEFATQNLQLATFVVSVYILGFAAGPLVIAPLSEIYGRVPVYHVCNIGFTAFAIACAMAPNMHLLIFFRFLNGVFGSCPATIGGGSITDMIPQERRASVIAAYSIGALFAPIVGPVVGGLLAHAMGWRWSFWLLAIAGFVFSAVQLVVLRETYHPVLLQRKVTHLRVITGRKQLRSSLDTGLSSKAYFVRNLVRPAKMLTLSPLVIIVSLFIAITYGYMYVLLTSLTEVFQEYYHFDTSNVGICFIGLGVGSFLGVMVFSAVSDRILKSKAVQAAQDEQDADASTKPEYRLPPLPFAVLSLILGLLMYGWSAHFRIHWSVPVTGTLFIGLGQLLLYMVLQMYLIDSFTIYAASAVAAITAVRSVAGALLPLAGLSLYETLGIGWGNTLLAAVCIPLLGVSWGLLQYGERLRKTWEIKSL